MVPAAGALGEFEFDEDHRARPRRHRAVVDPLRTHEEIRLPCLGVEPAARGIAEARGGDLREASRRFEHPAGLVGTTRLEHGDEIEEAFRQERVILELAGDSARRAQQPRAVFDEMAEEHLVGDRDGRVDEACSRLAQRFAATSEPADRQAVPAREHLVVAGWLFATIARHSERRLDTLLTIENVCEGAPAAIGQLRRRLLKPKHPGGRLVGMVRIAEVRLAREAVGLEGPVDELVESRFAECGANLLGCPQVAQPLTSLRLRIERGGESALDPHLAKHPLEGAAKGSGQEGLGAAAQARRERLRKLPVVVEHLLEVRHRPRRVDGVPMEAAAHVIEEPAERHRLEGPIDGRCEGGPRDRRRLEQPEVDRLRKLRGAAEAPVLAILEGPQRIRGALEDRRIERDGVHRARL
ncbi:MAG: hypothetical protein ACO4CI_07795, partial [Phycisphaerales bacterium]